MSDPPVRLSAAPCARLRPWRPNQGRGGSRVAARRGSSGLSPRPSGGAAEVCRARGFRPAPVPVPLVRAQEPDGEASCRAVSCRVPLVRARDPGGGVGTPVRGASWARAASPLPAPCPVARRLPKGCARAGSAAHGAGALPGGLRSATLLAPPCSGGSPRAWSAPLATPRSGTRPAPTRRLGRCPRPLPPRVSPAGHRTHTSGTRQTAHPHRTSARQPHGGTPPRPARRPLDPPLLSRPLPRRSRHLLGMRPEPR